MPLPARDAVEPQHSRGWKYSMFVIKMNRRIKYMTYNPLTCQSFEQTVHQICDFVCLWALIHTIKERKNCFCFDYSSYKYLVKKAANQLNEWGYQKLGLLYNKYDNWILEFYYWFKYQHLANYLYTKSQNAGINYKLQSGSLLQEKCFYI